LTTIFKGESSFRSTVRDDDHLRSCHSSGELTWGLPSYYIEAALGRLGAESSVCFLKSFHVYYDALVYQVPSREMLSHFSKPQLFLPVIDTCDVLEDDGQTVLREVKFKDGNS
jgi:hypothetical protein